MTQLIRETAGRSFNHSQVFAGIRSGRLETVRRVPVFVTSFEGASSFDPRNVR